MIPNNRNSFVVENNLGGEKVKMQISADATAHLMGLLTDLYSDPELACIREYSTNAWDAHIDAGNMGNPIQVFTPTHLDPYLTIKDFGIGMDETTIREIYSQYGESTKRDQKTTNGSMGIGAKAALGYTNQFTVAGIKNGIKTLVSVSRDEDGSGVMEIVFTGKTTEANGVEIKIPVKPGNQFEWKARDFFSYWKKGTVLLNGKNPVVEREALTDRIFFTDSRGTDLIVMGNVAYPVDMGNYSISGQDGRKVACYVEMNGKDEVVFTPSREGLIYNSVTKSAVVNLRNEYQKTIREHVASSLTGAKTYAEAYNKMLQFTGKYRWINGSVEWNGIPVHNFHIMDPKRLDPNGKVQRAQFLRYNPNTTYRPVSSGNELNYNQIRNDEYVVVLGYPAKKTLSGASKERIKEFVFDIEKIATNNRYSYINVYLTDLTELTNDKAFDYKAERIYKWSDILAVTREPAVAVAKTAGKYHCWDGTNFSLREVKVDEKIVFWSPARDAYKPKFEYVLDMEKNMPEYTLIADNANRHDKIKKDFKNSQEWRQFAKTYEASVAKRDFDKLDAAFFEHYYIHQHTSRRDLLMDKWGGLPALTGKALDSLLDKEYARIVRLAFTPTKHIGFAAQHHDFDKSVKAARPKFFDRNLIRDYPMLTTDAWSRDPNAVAEYMNERFANGKVKN